MVVSNPVCQAQGTLGQDLELGYMHMMVRMCLPSTGFDTNFGYIGVRSTLDSESKSWGVKKMQGCSQTIPRHAAKWSSGVAAGVDRS